MRLVNVSVKNFRGLQEATLPDLGSITLLTGRNGTGKSNLLEALQILTGCLGGGPSRRSVFDLIHQGARTAHLGVDFTLSVSEFNDVDRFCRSRTGRPAREQESYTREVVIHETGRLSATGSQVAQALFDPAFQESRRTPSVHMVSTAWAYPVGLATDRIDSSDALSAALASLDHRCLRDRRHDRGSPGDYSEVVERFRQTTGMHLSEPDVTHGVNRFHVDLGRGQRHGLSGLSSGEQGLLRLLCELYETAATGGILLLDEPEVHLHPSFQSALLSAVRALSGRMQTLLVTHSPQMVSGVQGADVYEVRKDPPQALRRVSASDRLRVFGSSRAGALTASARLIVEGPNDKDRLRALFPEETGKIHIEVAGNRSSVMDHYKVLASDANFGLRPWLCLIDRDLLSAAAIVRYAETHPHLHIWPRRALESMLLDPQLLAALLTDLGRSVTVRQAEEMLFNAVDGLKAKVSPVMVKEGLSKHAPMPRLGAAQTIAEFEDFHARCADVYLSRRDQVADAFRLAKADVEERWAAERFELVDPKEAMGRLSKIVKLNQSDLIGGLIRRASVDAAARPKGLEALRIRLEALTGNE
ncbi:ATP-dependent nuclease [Streptomyces fildesensis]|uniref:ATP-dependent nuclease n=1 Tax=Streptomyces fildesensis TaxID=375757 RepID=UPI0018DF7AB5|nr:ATP-binding protein [Streptomyces fildesensis]